MEQYRRQKEGRDVLDDVQVQRRDYVLHYHGVDIIDQKDSAYLADRQSKKNMWHRVFQHNNNMAITLAVEHYKQVKLTLKPKPNTKLHKYLHGNYYPITARWHLFAQMKERCQLGQVGPKPTGRSGQARANESSSRSRKSRETP